MSPASAYFLLSISVITEILSTSVLPATKGFTVLKPSIFCIIGYIICFYTMGLSLQYINLGIAYGTWGALGTVLTPAIGYIFYKQKITKMGFFACILIVVGVLIMNIWG